MPERYEESSANSFDWYADADGDLEQGDILLSFRLLLPYAMDDGEIALKARDGRGIVLTQTCDVPKPAQRTLLIAEVHDYEDMIQNGRNQHLRESAYKKSLARGMAISDFLLPPSPGGQLGWSIVSFRDVFVMPKLMVVSKATEGTGLRLKSPYKEYLSQSFARFMMRVGLPTTLSSFEKR